jgi:Fe-S cluster assembly ATP-binding protein
MLEINNLQVSIEDRKVVDGITFGVKPGEVVAVMGPNGSGKSSTAYGIMGHPLYKTSGEIKLDDEDISEFSPDQRAQAGLFLAFQYPVGIPGVNVREILLASMRTKDKDVKALELKKAAIETAKWLTINEELLSRDINMGFSGGEKKKMEILQLLTLGSKYAILDETDSGLDVDALKIVAEGATRAAKEKNCGVLVITHYQRLLEYLRPDRVIILKSGKIVDEGSFDLVKSIEQEGYKKYD